MASNQMGALVGQYEGQQMPFFFATIMHLIWAEKVDDIVAYPLLFIFFFNTIFICCFLLHFHVCCYGLVGVPILSEDSASLYAYMV
ncbi:hypothetical protein DsansV1_C23g0174391 [Dioscorea sansibarensis]